MTITATKTDVSATTGYHDKLLGLLGGRDPMDVLASMPDALDRMISAHPSAVLRRRPYADRWTWTPLEVVGHLIDAEFVYAFRVRLILCEDRPTILGMDQEKWVLGQRYNEREPREVLADFRALRSISLRLWRLVGPNEEKRVGVHNERGEESLGLMRKMNAGHDLSHIEQLTKYLKALAG